MEKVRHKHCMTQRVTNQLVKGWQAIAQSHHCCLSSDMDHYMSLGENSSDCSPSTGSPVLLPLL